MRQIRPKRSLGQNFFINKTLGEKIVRFANETTPDLILEIGPGTGSFTGLLAQTEAKVLCIEKDDQLAARISNLFPQVKVLNQDVLTVTESELDKEISAFQSKVCFGSLPYNISKQIIRKFIEEAFFNRYYFIIQKEVAEKYTAAEGKSNILNLTSSIYSDMRILLKISPEAFTPRPNVVSSLIMFTPNLKIKDQKEREAIELLINKAFSQPRKTLFNNLKKDYIFNSDRYKEMRAEQLKLQDFIELKENLSRINL